MKMKRVKRKDQEVALAQGRRDSIKHSMKLKFKEQKKDNEVANSVFQTSITGVYKRQLSSNKWEAMVNLLI